MTGETTELHKFSSISLDTPEDAQLFFEGSWYKIGARGYLYVWVRAEWRRSSRSRLNTLHLIRRIESHLKDLESIENNATQSPKDRLPHQTASLEPKTPLHKKDRSSDHPLYKVWIRIRQRCYNMDHPAYKHYGLQGVTVGSEWNVFKSFINDMGSGYQEGKSLRRIDPHKPYCKENCYWGMRRAPRRTVEDEDSGPNGNLSEVETPWGVLSLKEAAAKVNMNPTTLRSRLRHGKTIKEALFTPVRVLSKPLKD